MYSYIQSRLPGGSRRRGYSKDASDPSSGALSDDKMKLTLGSAVKDGKFLRSSNAWALESVEEGGRATAREQLETHTQTSMV